MLGRIRSFLNGLPRRGKSLVLVAFDAVALLVVLWASYQLRLGGTFAPNQPQLLLMLLAPLIALPVFLRFGLYRAVIRYLPERAIWTILQAMLARDAALGVRAVHRRGGAVRRVAPLHAHLLLHLRRRLLIGGARFAAKAMLWEPRENKVSAVTMLIYGAGEAGRQLATALRTRGGGGFVAGFSTTTGSCMGPRRRRPACPSARPARSADPRSRRQRGDPVHSLARRGRPPAHHRRAEPPAGPDPHTALDQRNRLGQIPRQPTARDRYRRSARPFLGARRSRPVQADDRRPHHHGDGGRRLDRLRTLPDHRRLAPEEAGAVRGQRVRALPDRPPARLAMRPSPWCRCSAR
jgi:hypothetical protein